MYVILVSELTKQTATKPANKSVKNVTIAAQKSSKPPSSFKSDNKSDDDEKNSNGDEDATQQRSEHDDDSQGAGTGAGGFNTLQPDSTFHASSTILLSRGKTAFSVFEPDPKFDANGNQVEVGTTVLLHGLTDSSYIWEDIVEVLMCEDIIECSPRVVIFDFYGRGRSPWTGFPCTLDVFVTQMKELLDHLHLSNKPVDLIGYCLGGAVATGFSVKFPNLVKSLCIINSAGVRMKNPARYEILKKKCVGEFVMLKGQSKMGEGQLEHYYDTSVGSPHKVMIDKQIAMINWQLKNTPGYVGAILSTYRYFPLAGMGDLFIVAGRRARPVLVIWGNDDNFFPLRKALGVIESAFPDAEIISIKECGHNPMFEKFDDVATAIAEFYREIYSKDEDENRDKF
jgi:pimeloyl-ACP methyl ester carboxylesterase